MRQQTISRATVGTTTWLCPGGVTRVRLRGWGGGGGGGSGNSGPTSGTGFWLCGGAGGGGAMCHEVYVTVVPGTTYELVIPAAAAGAPYTARINSATPVNGVAGSDGGTAIFKVQAGATLASFQGAMRGDGGTSITSGSTNFIYAIGGGPTISHTPSFVYQNLRGESYGFFRTGPGFGGYGMTTNGNRASNTRRGCASLQGFAGGAGGATVVEVAPAIFTGTGNFTTWGEMGPGGGGGAGPGGVGGDGAYGDDVTFFSVPGGSAAAGSGAGGGGGAAGAQTAYPSNGNGGAGGAGGCGSLFLTWEA